MKRNRYVRNKQIYRSESVDYIVCYTGELNYMFVIYFNIICYATLFDYARFSTRVYCKSCWPSEIPEFELDGGYISVVTAENVEGPGERAIAWTGRASP